MADPLVDYIKKHVDAGESIETVRSMLLDNDFPASVIESAIQEYLRTYAHEETKRPGLFSRVFSRKPKIAEQPRAEPEAGPVPVEEIAIETPKPKRGWHFPKIRIERKPKMRKEWKMPRPHVSMPHFKLRKPHIHLPKISLKKPKAHLPKMKKVAIRKAPKPKKGFRMPRMHVTMPKIHIPRFSFRFHLPKIRFRRKPKAKPVAVPVQPKPMPIQPAYQPKKKESVMRPLKIALLVVLMTLSIVLAIPPALDYYSRVDADLPNVAIPFVKSEEEKIELAEVNCAESGLFVERAIWSPEIRHMIITVRNSGNVRLQGFDAQILLRDFELGNSTLHDRNLAMKPETREDFFLIGPDSCEEIDRFTFKSLQCPNNALHTVKQNEIQNC